MKKEKLFYSEDDILDEEDKLEDDELKTLIGADNVREQYGMCAHEVSHSNQLILTISLALIGIMILFLWLSFSVFPQHTFSFNFGEGTYTKILLPSIQSIIMSITVLVMNFLIQITGFYWTMSLRKQVDSLVKKSKTLEFRELLLNSNLFNKSPILPCVTFLHGLLIAGSLVAVVSYIVLAFV